MAAGSSMSLSRVSTVVQRSCSGCSDVLQEGTVPADAGLPPVDEALVFGRCAGTRRRIRGRALPPAPPDLGEAEDQLAVHGQVAANRSAVRLLSGRREGVAGGQDSLRQCGFDGDAAQGGGHGVRLLGRLVAGACRHGGGESDAGRQGDDPADEPTTPESSTGRPRENPFDGSGRTRLAPSLGARSDVARVDERLQLFVPPVRHVLHSPPPSAKPGRLRPPAPLSLLRTATRALPQSRS